MPRIGADSAATVRWRFDIGLIPIAIDRNRLIATD